MLTLVNCIHFYCSLTCVLTVKDSAYTNLLDMCNMIGMHYSIGLDVKV